MPTKTFLRSRLINNEAMAAGAAVRTDALPVNPLSVVYLTIRAQSTTANAVGSLANLLATISRVEIAYKGQNIVSASPADLVALAALFSSKVSNPITRGDSANANSWITIPILLGRRWYDMDECFPASRRGELLLQITPAAAFTGWGTVTLQAETVELLEAQPKTFLKYTTITKTPTATGDHDTDLPIGNPILGTLLFGTTVPTDASLNKSINQLRLLLDNVEYDYAFTFWETLQAEGLLDVPSFMTLSEHTHRENTAGAYAQNAATLQALWTTHLLENYALLDFDPDLTGDYALMTEGRSRVTLRINADVADAIRVIPIERIAVGQRAGA